jgi:hypothetical protein
MKIRAFEKQGLLGNISAILGAQEFFRKLQKHVQKEPCFRNLWSSGVFTITLTKIIHYEHLRYHWCF